MYEDFLHLGNICLATKSFTRLNNFTTLEKVDEGITKNLMKHVHERENSSKKTDTLSFLSKVGDIFYVSIIIRHNLLNHNFCYKGGTTLS